MIEYQRLAMVHHSLGKGEARGSIPRGSTRFSPGIPGFWVIFHIRSLCRIAQNKAEKRILTGEKLVRSVRGLFSCAVVLALTGNVLRNEPV